MGEETVSNTQSAKNAYGMLLCGLAAFFFALTAVIVKMTTFPKTMLLEARSLLQIIYCLIFIYFLNPQVELLGPKHTRFWLVLRGIFYWGFILFYWFALSFLPIGDATCFAYCSPVIGGLLGFVWLKEPFHWSYIVFTILNLSGMVLVAKPSFMFGSDSDSLNPLGVTFALIAAVLCGALGPFVRKSKDAHWASVEFYAHTSSGLLLTPLLIGSEALFFAENVLPDAPIPWFSMFLISFTGFAGLAALTQGYQLAHASIASLLCYLEIPLSYVFQVYIFHDGIDFMSILGCSLIVGSGLLSVSKQYLASKSKKLKIYDDETKPLLHKTRDPRVTFSEIM